MKIWFTSKCDNIKILLFSFRSITLSLYLYFSFNSIKTLLLMASDDSVPQVNSPLCRKFLRSLFHFLLSCFCITHTSHEGQEVPNLSSTTPILFYTSVLFISPSDCPILPKAASGPSKHQFCVDHWQFVVLSPQPLYFALFFLRSYFWQGLPADLHKDKAYVNLSPTPASPFHCYPIFN